MTIDETNNSREGRLSKQSTTDFQAPKCSFRRFIYNTLENIYRFLRSIIAYHKETFDEDLVVANTDIDIGEIPFPHIFRQSQEMPLFLSLINISIFYFQSYLLQQVNKS